MNKSVKLSLLAGLIFYLPGLEKVSAQIDTICATRASRYQISFMDQRLEEINDYIELRKQLKLQQSIVSIPIKVHMIRYSDGSGSYDSAMIDSIFSLVNEAFINGNMEFVRCEPINYIDSNALYILDEIEYDWVVSNV